MGNLVTATVDGWFAEDDVWFVAIVAFKYVFFPLEPHEVHITSVVGEVCYESLSPSFSNGFE